MAMWDMGKRGSIDAMGPRETMPDSDAHGRGGVVLAAVLMIVAGLLWALEGLAGLLSDTSYGRPQHFLSTNPTLWGWMHLVLGVVVVAAGFNVMTGARWARIVGIVLACVSVVLNFLFLPYAAAWSLTIIVIDLLVIFALTGMRQDWGDA